MAALLRWDGAGRGTGRPGRSGWGPWTIGLGLAALLTVTVAGCSGGEGGVSLPSNRPSAERTTDATTESTTEATTEATRSERPSRETPSREPTATKTTAAAEPTGTTARPETTPTVQEATATRTTEAATPTAQVSEVAAASADDGLGAGGWLLIVLILLLVALVGVLLVNRSRRRSDWDTELAIVAPDTQTAMDQRLPRVLSTRTAPERALAWPPLRADLIALAGRWNALAGGASDEGRQYPASQLASLLPEMVAAVDAENEAVATRRDWQLLRPRITDLEQLIRAALATFAAPATTTLGQDPYGSPGPDPYGRGPAPGPYGSPGPDPYGGGPAPGPYGGGPEPGPNDGPGPERGGPDPYS